jgi:hypothetical protein
MAEASCCAPLPSASDGANDVMIGQTDATEEGLRPETSGHHAQGLHRTDESTDDALNSMSKQLPSEGDQPHANGDRTQPHITIDQGLNTSAGAERSGHEENGQGHAVAENGRLAALTDVQLLERARKVLTGAEGGPKASGDGGIGGHATVAHCVRVKAAVNTIFERHAASICCSGERPDLQLSKEEALGHIMVDLVLGPVKLLPREPREIGKRVDNHATREKKADEKAKGRAKDARKHARTAAAKDAAKAAALDATLGGIDADLEAKCADRLGKVVDLGLPDRRTVVVDAKPVSAGLAEAKAVDKLISPSARSSRCSTRPSPRLTQTVLLRDAGRIAARSLSVKLSASCTRRPFSVRWRTHARRAHGRQRWLGMLRQSWLLVTRETATASACKISMSCRMLLRRCGRRSGMRRRHKRRRAERRQPLQPRTQRQRQ